VLLFFLVTHEYPIEGRTVTDVVMAHGLGRRKLLSDLRPDLPDAFVGVVERALSPTPERRFKTAGTMMRELAEAAPGMSESWRGRMAAALEPAESTGPARPGPDAALEAGTRVQRPAQPRLPPRVEAEPASPAAARLIWWTAAAIAAVLAVGFLGLATTAAFDMTLGREAFTDSSVAVWLLYGVRTLVPMMVYAGLTLVFARVVQFAWRLLRNIIPPLQRFHDPVSATLAGLTLRLGLQDTATAAQGFFLLQVFSVFVLWWAFADLIAALVMLVNDDPEVSYAPLAPDNQSRFAFRPILTAVLVGMVAGWRSLLTKPVRGRAIDWGAKAGGFALIGVVLLMAAVPYRLLSYSAFPRVDFNGQRCYQTGTSGNRVLLLCPDSAPPRNRTVFADDPALEPTGVIESVFSPPSGSHQ
jgi:hypothetical protein